MNLRFYIKDEEMKFYQRLHQNKANLLIHIVGVPVFIIGNISLLIAIVNLNILSIVLSFLAIITSLGAQDRGHKFEKVAFEPFKNLLDFFKTIYLDQFIVFPIFFFSKYFRENWNR